MGIFQGIYIPVRSPPKVKTIDIDKGDIDKQLRCTQNWHITIWGLLGYELGLFYDIDAHKKSLLENPLATRLVHLRLGNNKLAPIWDPVLLIDDVKNLTLDDFCYLLKKPYNEVRVKETKDRLLSRFPVTIDNFDPVTGEKKTERFWLNCSQIFSYDDIHFLLTTPYSETDRYRKLRCRLLALAETQIGDSIKSDQKLLIIGDNSF